jgi:hypothetical protein
VGEQNIRPKSIAREMFEGFRSFSDYVQEYDLERAEGLLLRHLHSVFKVLTQTVPDTVKSDSVREIELYLQDMLRQVDSSLLDEWERMRDPEYRPWGAAGTDVRPARPEEPPDVTRATPRPSPRRSARVCSPSCAPGRSGSDEAALALPRIIRRRRRGTLDPRATARRRARLIAPSTAASASTRRPATSATLMSDVCGGPSIVARAADARGPGGSQRLGRGARGRHHVFASGRRARAATAAARKPGVIPTAARHQWKFVISTTSLSVDARETSERLAVEGPVEGVERLLEVRDLDGRTAASGLFP